MTVGQRHDAALAQHDIKIQLAAEILVELERVIEKRGALRPEIVRPCHLRVATRITAAQVTLLDNGDVRNAVLFG